MGQPVGVRVSPSAPIVWSVVGGQLSVVCYLQPELMDSSIPCKSRHYFVNCWWSVVGRWSFVLPGVVVF